jgi:hypothetical protein
MTGASDLDVSDLEVSPIAGPGEVSTLVLKLWRELYEDARQPPQVRIYERTIDFVLFRSNGHLVQIEWATHSGEEMGDEGSVDPTERHVKTTVWAQATSFKESESGESNDEESIQRLVRRTVKNMISYH